MTVAILFSIWHHLKSYTVLKPLSVFGEAIHPGKNLVKYYGILICEGKYAFLVPFVGHFDFLVQCRGRMVE